ncbi:MAG: hypothetical protein IJ428_05775 [Clostridia bacterium]|nr:hypothetical protein [Clostridia bacterium]
MSVELESAKRIGALTQKINTTLGENFPTLSEAVQAALDAQQSNDGSYDEGYSAGYTQGKQDGHSEGYESGKADGVQEGYTNGVADGKQAEYDAFWDAYQPNGGGLTHYNGAFAGTRWTSETFRPKYDIVPNYANLLFWASEMEIDLAQHLEDCGVKLDFSQTWTGTQAFAYSWFTRIGEISLNANRNYTSMFGLASKLKTIDKFTMRDGVNINNAFENCTALENIIFDGAISVNGLNLQWSTLLSHDSLMSIINALEDYSADTSGTAWTVTIGDNIAKLTDEELQIAKDKGWTVV